MNHPSARRHLAWVSCASVGMPGWFWNHSACRDHRGGVAWSIVLDDTVGECSALPGSVVCVLVPRTLAIQESVQVRLVEGGAELGPFSDNDGVLRATLAVLVLGRLGTVVFLPVMRWAIFPSAFRAIVPPRGILRVVVLGLVPAVGSLGFFHVSVLVDDCHHVAHGLWVAFEHLPP